MLKKFFIAIVLTGFAVQVHAADQIILEEGALYNQYSLDGGSTYKPLNMSGEAEVRSLISNNQDAREKLKSYDGLTIGSYVCAGLGGFMIGWPLGGSLGGNPWTDTDTILIGGGVLLVTGAFILNAMAWKTFKDAVNIYNQDITSFFHSPNHNFALTYNGREVTAGMQFRF